MSSLGDQCSSRLNDYKTTRFEPYINWYVENIRISKNNLFAALVVIGICASCFLFIPSPMDQMTFFQYSFDPTIAVQLGLFSSIALALVSTVTTCKKIKSCLTAKALLQTEHAIFNARKKNDSGPNDDAAFETFVNAVESIIAATNPEVVIAVLENNPLNEEAEESEESTKP